MSNCLPLFLIFAIGTDLNRNGGENDDGNVELIVGVVVVLAVILIIVIIVIIVVIYRWRSNRGM